MRGGYICLWRRYWHDDGAKSVGVVAGEHGQADDQRAKNNRC
ncbi:hypothetical protein ACNHIR_13490 [Klebsiella michiganensis]